MKKAALLLASGLFFVSSGLYAHGNNTDMHSNWICTTNASSSDVESEKAADKQMSNNATSAANAYSFAMQHCRNCTKITCKTKD